MEKRRYVYFLWKKTMSQWESWKGLRRSLKKCGWRKEICCLDPRSCGDGCPFLKTQLDSSLSLIISLIIPATETSIKKRILAQKAAHQPTAIILPLRRVLKSPWMLGESLKSSWILNVIGSKEYFFAVLKTGRQNLFKRKQLFNILDEISSAGGLLGKLNYTSFYPTNLPTPHLLDHFCRTFSSHPTLS